MRPIYWLGGSPCAGKSTVADRLAEQYDLFVYHVDYASRRHASDATVEHHPTFVRLNNLSDDELWMRPIEEQVRTEIGYCADQFDLISADLRSLSTDRPVLVEGAALLPSLVAQHLAENDKAVWMFPTESFQRHHYAKRPWIHDTLSSCTDPQQAFENWMARDARFAQWMLEQVQQLEQPYLIVSGSRSIEQTVELVKNAFDLDGRMSGS